LHVADDFCLRSVKETMMTMKGRSFLLGISAAAATAVLPLLAQDVPVSFHAVTVNMSNVGKPGISQVDVNIERWTSPEEFASLRDALLEKGTDGLLSQLQKIRPRVGSIRSTTGGLGWDIQFAQRTELPDGGHRVVFATDRPMSFYERVSQPPSADYEFLLGEMRIGPDGKGEGKLVPRARIRYNKGSKSIEIENYASEPVRLTQVTEIHQKTD
jgi:hypothetical protein